MPILPTLYIFMYIMPNAKTSFKLLVDRLHFATKIPKEDIKELLKLLPYAISETFFELNPPENTLVNFVFTRMYWHPSKKFGSEIRLVKSNLLGDCLSTTKVEQKSELAKKLFSVSTSANKKRMLDKKAKSENANN